MRNLISIILVGLVLSSCSSGNKKQFQKLYYRFPEPQAIQLNQSLIINKPTALGIFANRPLIAVDPTGALKQMNYSFWLESPKVLLNKYLHDFLQTDSLIPEKSSILYTEILKLEKQQDLATVAINFKLISPNGELKFDKTFNKQLQASDIGVSQFVKSIGKLLKEVTNDLYQEAFNHD